jgi:hypothetical protein
MSFTQAYGNILLPFVENYKTSKNEKARKAIVETAVNTILNSRNLLEEQGLDLPQDLRAVRPILILLSLLSLPLMMINPGHPTVYKRKPQKTKEPHRRRSRGG